MKHKTIRVGIVPNAFKGSLTASEAACCIERGLKKALAGVSTLKVPVADGGDGTALAIIEATNGKWVRCSVEDPLGHKIKSGFGLTGDGKTAVIEMAAASGLMLLQPHERNPLLTSTYGTGQLIRAALDRNVSQILIGIGGSATNDGGMGMARALGVRFLDAHGCDLDNGGAALLCLSHIDKKGLDPRIANVQISVACDVDNPLYGPRGAACVYAPQKGATPAMVKTLDAGLKQLARVIKKDLRLDVTNLPGAGAAGGLGAGLVAFLGGTMRPGVEIVMETVDLRNKLAGCDLVITGEGRLDGQTSFGKAPAGVARLAKELGIPVVAICGSLGLGVDKVHAAGIDAFFSALEESLPESDVKSRAPGMLERCAEQVGRLLALPFGLHPS